MYSKQTPSTQRRQQRSLQRNRNFGTHTASASLGPVTTTLFFVAIIAVLALMYLTQVTKTSVYGYEINQLEEEQQALTEQQQELEAEAARLQSVARIEDSAIVEEMQAESSVTYDHR